MQEADKQEGLRVRSMLRSNNTLLQSAINTSKSYEDFCEKMRVYFPSIYVKFKGMELSDGAIWKQGL